MYASVRTATFTLIVGLASLWIPTQQVHAGPFLDWLFHRSVQVYPAPVDPSAPVVTVPGQTAFYAPSAATTSIAGPGGSIVPATVATPGVVGQPVVAASPVVVQSPVVSAAPVQPVITGYTGGYTTYRTTWNRIPVTYYKPVTSYVAGYPTVTAQPCNTCTVQAQRVPTSGWGGWHHQHRGFRPWVPFMGAPTTSGYAPQAVVSAPGCVGCQPGTSGALPYGSPVVSSTVAPAGATTTIPGQYSVPGQYSGSLNSTVPADQAPTLLQNNNSATFQNNNSTTPVTPVTPQDTSPALQSIPNAGNSGTPDAGTPPALLAPAGTSSAQRATNSPYRVTPIPAPDLRTFESPRPSPQAPPLLNRRDRTVSNSAGQSVNVETASWVTAKPVAPAASATKSVSEPVWHSVK